VLDGVVFGPNGEYTGTLELAGAAPTTTRGILNAILTFIGATSLTDDEFDDLDVDEDTAAADVYQALAAVLGAREAVSSQTERLRNYFLAKGVVIDPAPEVDETKTQIFLGADLDEEFDEPVAGRSNIFVGGEL